MDTTQGFPIQVKLCIFQIPDENLLFPHDAYEVFFPWILFPYDLTFVAFSSINLATSVVGQLS